MGVPIDSILPSDVVLDDPVQSAIAPEDVVLDVSAEISSADQQARQSAWDAQIAYNEQQAAEQSPPLNPAQQQADQLMQSQLQQAGTVPPMVDTVAQQAAVQPAPKEKPPEYMQLEGGLVLHGGMENELRSILNDRGMDEYSKMVRIASMMQGDPETKRVNEPWLNKVKFAAKMEENRAKSEGVALGESSGAEAIKGFLQPFYLGLKSYAGGLSLGATDIAFNALENATGGAVEGETGFDTASQIVGGLGGGISTGMGLGKVAASTIAKTGLTNPAVVRTLTTLSTGAAMTLANNTTGLLSGRVKPEEWAGNVAQDIGANMLAAGVNLGPANKYLNSGIQVATDVLYDVATDWARGYLPVEGGVFEKDPNGKTVLNQEFMNWLVTRELPNIIASASFAGRDLADPNFRQTQSAVHQGLTDIKNRAKASIENWASGPVPAMEPRFKSMGMDTPEQVAEPAVARTPQEQAIADVEAAVAKLKAIRVKVPVPEEPAPDLVPVPESIKPPEVTPEPAKPVEAPPPAPVEVAVTPAKQAENVPIEAKPVSETPPPPVEPVKAPIVEPAKPTEPVAAPAWETGKPPEPVAAPVKEAPAAVPEKPAVDPLARPEGYTGDEFQRLQKIAADRGVDIGKQRGNSAEDAMAKLREDAAKPDAEKRYADFRAKRDAFLNDEQNAEEIKLMARKAQRLRSIPREDIDAVATKIASDVFREVSAIPGRDRKMAFLNNALRTRGMNEYRAMKSSGDVSYQATRAEGEPVIKEAVSTEPTPAEAAMRAEEGDAVEVKRTEQRTKLAALMPKLAKQIQELIAKAGSGEELTKSEQASIIRAVKQAGGPGAAFANDPDFFRNMVFSPKKAFVTEKMEEMGYDPAIPEDKVSWKTESETVKSDLAKNPNMGKEIYNTLKDSEEPPTSTEIFHLDKLFLDTEARMRQMDGEITQLGMKRGNEKRIAELSALRELANQEAEDILRVTLKTGKESGRAFKARQAFVDRDMNLVNMEMEAKARANAGKPLTPEQKAEIARIRNEYEKLKSDIEARKKTSTEKVDRELYRMEQRKEAIRAEWKAKLKRWSTDADKWTAAMDAHLKERGRVLPDAVRNDIISDFKKAASIVDDAGRDKAVALAIDKFVGHVPIRAGDWFDAYIYTNMLSGPKSHERNLYGNTLNAFFFRPATLLARGQVKGSATYTRKALQTAFNGEALRDAITAFKSGEEGKMMESIRNPKVGKERDHAIETAKRIAGPKNRAGKIAWKSLTAVGRFLHAADIFTGKMINAGETARLMEQGKSPEFIKQTAERLEKEYLYRDPLGVPDKSLDPVTKTLAHLGTRIDSFRNMPYLGRPARMFVPFLKTLVKIAEFNNSFSYLGFIGAQKGRIAKAHYGESYDTLVGNLKAENAKPKPDIETVIDLENRIAEVDETSAERQGRAAVGTVITALGTIAAMTGNTTWGAPEDEQAKKIFYDSGRKPYSFRVGDRWIPMMYLGPGMVPFAIAAAAKDVLIDNPKTRNENMPSKIGRLLLAVPAMMADQLPLAGLGDFLNLVQGKVDYKISRVVGGLLTELVPAAGALRWIKEFVDPVYRKPHTIGETIAAGIPGLSKYVQSIKDSRGLDAKQDVVDALLPYKRGIISPSDEKQLQERMSLLKERESQKAKPESALNWNALFDAWKNSR